MKAYYVNADYAESETVPYYATLKAARSAAKQAAGIMQTDVPVEKVEIAIDRDAILNMLNTNGDGAHISLGVVFTAYAQDD